MTERPFRHRQLFSALACTVLIIAVVTSLALPAQGKSYSGDGSGAVQTLSKFGSRGEEVRKIQKKLKSLGYYKGNIDGIYGSETKRAVISFQKSRNLTADGIAGTRTLSALGLSKTSAGGGNSYSSSDRTLLAKVISAEARGESYTGQVAVGAVILNRVEHSSFPDSIAGVIYQPGAFSCVNDSNWYAPVADSAVRAAQDCLNGQDPSGGAIYYYNPAKTTNKWMLSRPKIITIGSHIFCK